jgi:hypothetical protein
LVGWLVGWLVDLLVYNNTINENFCAKGLNLDKTKTMKATYSASSKTG